MFKKILKLKIEGSSLNDKILNQKNARNPDFKTMFKSFPSE